MPKQLPPTFRRTHEEDVLADVEGARGTTMTERGLILSALCRFAAEQINQHPDPHKALAWQDPLPEESIRLLARLREQTRTARAEHA